ncbi:MAG: tetratricopeptide repeat protein [Patescibacteria group bacterium]|jgi:tetratricopeptide (TPR) repeat protein
MILDYIAIGIIVLCVGIVLVVLGRKFPVLASLNVTDLPQHKHSQVKAVLIERRLSRKVTTFISRVQKYTKPLQVIALSSIHRMRMWIRALESKYQVPTQALSSTNKVEREQQIRRLMEEGAECFRNAEYGDAEKKFIEVISLDPKSVSAYKSLGDVYTGMKDYEHAKEVFTYALKLNQGDDSTHASLGRIATAMGRFEEARDEYLASVQYNSQIADHHIDLGETYANLHDNESALRSFQEAVKLEPNNPRNLDALIEHALNMKNAQVAKETIGRLREVNEENQKLPEFEERLDSLLKKK